MDYIYTFGVENSPLACPPEKLTKEILGGKGWGLAVMHEQGLPVPPGLTITTEAHAKYRSLPPGMRQGFMHTLLKQVREALTLLPTIPFGNAGQTILPLLSVRSGAPVSMPGMMDTILNVGITSDNVATYGAILGEKAAYDSYRRLVQMLGTTAHHIEGEVFEALLTNKKQRAGVENDSDLPLSAQTKLVFQCMEAFEQHSGYPFPDDLDEQLGSSIMTVFDSWDLPRAKHYRSMTGISEDMGTAVNVQSMVFGNLGETSGTGVFFTRDPNTGEREIYGEFLVNAQGEDVVAGVRTPHKMAELVDLPEPWPSVSEELNNVADQLEAYYKDMVDCEFTVEHGKLYILQSRVGKRTAPAAVKIATDLADEGLILPSEIKNKVTPEQYQKCMIDYVDPDFQTKPAATGIPACSGVVTGVIVTSSEDAINCTEPCILVTKETTPDDIAGMDAAIGILTQTGGTTSHAAVVARSMNKPCVVGCTALEFQGGLVGLNGTHWEAGTTVTIDGATGRIWKHTEVPVISLKNADFVARFEKMVASTSKTPLLMEDDTYPDWAETLWFSALHHDSLDAMLCALAEVDGDLSGHDLVLDFRAETEMHEDTDKFLFRNVMDFTSHLTKSSVSADALSKAKYRLINSKVLVEDKDLAKIFADFGAVVMGEAFTVKDLITGAGTHMVPDVVQKVFGDQQTMDQVLQTLGVSLVSMSSGPMTMEGIVLHALAEE